MGALRTGVFVKKIVWQSATIPIRPGKSGNGVEEIMSDPVVIAFIGVIGAVIGSVATISGNILMHWFKERSEAKKDKPRKELLKKMLDHPTHTWRNLDTLMNVIGASEEKTKTLLLEMGARGSEDGKTLWGLVSKNPLP